MSGSINLGQPVIEGGSGNSRVFIIGVCLFVCIGIPTFWAVSSMPSSDETSAARAEQNSAALERAVTLTDQGVAFVSCMETTCEQAFVRFNELVGHDHSYALANSIMDGNGMVIGYLYVDRRLQIVEPEE